MHNEWNEMAKLLCDPSADWKKRESALRRLEVSLVSGAPAAVEALNQYPHGLALQLNDLRSSIVKQASEAVVALAAARGRLRASPDRFAESFLKSADVHRALASANKVIAGRAAEAVGALARAGLVSPSAMAALNAAAAESKNAQFRERVAALFREYVERAPAPCGDRLEALRRAARAFAGDASAAVREHGRAAEAQLGRARTPPPNRAMSQSAISSSAVSAKSEYCARAAVRPFRAKAEPPITRFGLKELLREFSVCESESRCAEIAEKAQKANVASLGDALLTLLFAQSAPSDAIEQRALAHFGLNAFAEYFLSRNDAESLRLLREKLARENAPPRVAATLAKLLASNALAQSGAFARDCLALLFAAFPLEAARLPQKSALVDAARAAPSEDDRYERVDELVRRLQSAETRDERGIERVLGIAAEIARSGQSVLPIIARVSALAPTDESVHAALFKVCLIAFAATKHLRAELVKAVLELPQKATLAAALLRELEDAESDAEALAAALRFLAALLGRAGTAYEGPEFEEAVRAKLDRFARVARVRLICSESVKVRKFTVAFIVALNAVLQREQFLNFMEYFSNEQRKLIEYYLPKIGFSNR